jgi:hypothetical protein
MYFNNITSRPAAPSPYPQALLLHLLFMEFFAS